LTVLGVDADDRDANLEADPEDVDPKDQDAIHRGIHELPRRCDSVGGIPRIGEFPRSMCARTASRVQSGALHQRRRPAVLLRAGGGGAVVRGEFTLIPAPEERVPRRVVVRVEPRLGALLAAHALEDLVDGGVEGDALWQRWDRDAPCAQTPASGRAEVGRRLEAHRVEQPALPLVQGAPAEAVVGCAVRSCSPLLLVWRRWGVDWGEAGEFGRPDAR
jgi:hypothetical protein